VSSYRAIHLYCDGRVPVAEGKTRRCGKEFDSDPLLGFPALAVMRREARKAGWSYIRHPRVRSLDEDLCPDHKPED
jgi:hypothetical protein